MRRSRHNTCFFALLAFLSGSLLLRAQYGRGGGNGTTFSFGPAIGFYTLHSKHAVNPKGRMSLVAGFRREVKVDREFRTFVQFGAEYFVHGLSYASYYFTGDTLKLYDKNFAFEYALYVHEINVPIQLKILFNRGDNKLHSPYASVAYHLRYLLPGHLQVKQYGNLVRKDFPALKFRNYLLHDKVYAFVSLALGWQRNKISARGSAFFGELNFRYGFSDYYFERAYSASSVYINSTHLGLSLGLKF